MKIIDTSTQALATSLNFRQLRQEVLSSNIANSETPGYKAKVVDFEDALARAINVDGQEALNVNNPKHYNVGGGGFSTLSPRVYKDPNGVVSEDGNTVDREAEMVKMTENKIMYDASVQLLNKKLGLWKYMLSSER